MKRKNWWTRCTRVGRNSNRSKGERVVPRIKAVDGSFDAYHRIPVRRRAIENKSTRQVGTIGGEAKGLSAAPAKAADEELAVRGGDLQGILRRGIQVRRHLVWIQVAYCFHRFALSKIAATAAAGAHAGEEVGRNGDVARGGHL